MNSLDEFQVLHDYLFGDNETKLFVTLTKSMLVTKNYPLMKCLDLEGQAIQFFEENIFENLRLLESINLRDNLIVKLPDNLFANNSKLKVIMLRHNLIEELRAPVFSELPVLDMLDFGNNSILTVDKSCLKSDSLKCLNLSYNRINNLNCEAFRLVPKLIDLDLSFNCLEIVNISVPNLTCFNLNMNDVNYLQFDLPKLTSLQMDSNNIGSIEEIHKNCSESLHILYLDTNPINEIPKLAFHNFKRLESIKLTVHLNFSFESLVNLPQLRNFQLTFLGPFDFHINHVKNGFRNKRNLKTLKLNFANFHSIWFDLLPKINSLKFYTLICLTPNFEICTEIDIFEDILTKAPKLLSLTLQNLNNFRLKEIKNTDSIAKSLESLSIEGLRNSQLTNLFQNFYFLVTLEIVQSWMEKISKMDFRNLYFLKILNLSHSKIERVESECFHANKQLEYINLSSCLIEFIDNYCFEHLTNLKNLNFTKNPIRNVSSRVFVGIDFEQNILEHDPELLILFDF